MSNEGHSMYDIDDLIRVMERLRDPETGCPWDIKQDFKSIVPSTLEECYELAHAIEQEDFHHVGEDRRAEAPGAQEGEAGQGEDDAVLRDDVGLDEVHHAVECGALGLDADLMHRRGLRRDSPLRCRPWSRRSARLRTSRQRCEWPHPAQLLQNAIDKLNGKRGILKIIIALKH